MKKALWPIMAILGGMFSCQPEETTSPQGQEKTILSAFDEEVIANDNYLSFSSFEAFADSAAQFSKLTGYDRSRFETERNFISLNRIFEHMVDQENDQYDKEELMIRTYPELKKTMKHNFAPLTSYIASSISNDPSEGLTYRLFQPSYSYLLNKHRIVKIGKSILQLGEDYVKVIQDGNITHISKLDQITSNTQTDNLKFYPVTKVYYSMQEKNVRTNETVFCEDEIPNDLRLKAWTYGTFSFYFNAPGNNWFHRMGISIEMKFTRKTWLGWSNHRSENYSSNGTWKASSYRLSGPLPHPPTTSQTYSLGTNFQGKTSNPTHTFFYKEYYSPVGENLDFINVGGTQNFQFVEITCSNVD